MNPRRRGAAPRLPPRGLISGATTSSVPSVPSVNWAEGADEVFLLLFVHKKKTSLPSLRQNKKYRCAIGSTVAGSQVRSTPSARTS